MILVPKNNFFQEFTDTDKILKESDDYLLSLGDTKKHILSYDTTTVSMATTDTEGSIAFHTSEEIDMAIENIKYSFIKNFIDIYREENEIHDCTDSVNAIVLEIMEQLDTNSNRYFLPLYDYCETYMLKLFNSYRNINCHSDH